MRLESSSGLVLSLSLLGVVGVVFSPCLISRPVSDIGTHSPIRRTVNETPETLY